MDVQLDRLLAVSRMVFGSQRKMAEALGVHETSVSYWLNGQRRPTSEAVRKLEELGISSSFLTGESDVMFASNNAGRALAIKFPGGYTAWVSVVSAKEKLQQNLLKASAELLGKSRWRFNEAGDVVFDDKAATLSQEIDRITVDQQGDSEVVIPMLESSIPAGYKVPIYEDLATAFNVTSYYKNCFTMRVRGDSMVDAGILDGDRVVIKRGHRFRNGDVIAAVVDGEITLKGVWTEDDRIHLVPANEKYPVYVVPEEASFECLGVCIDTFRPPRKVTKR